MYKTKERNLVGLSFWEHLLCKTVIIQHNVVAAETLTKEKIFCLMTYTSLNEIKTGGVLLIKKWILWIREIRPVLGMAILNKEKSSKCVHRYLILKHKRAKWTYTILKWTWNERNHQLLRFAFSHIYLDDDDALKPVAARGSLYFAGSGWCDAAGCSSWLFLNFAGRGRCVADGCSSWLFIFRGSWIDRVKHALSR